jgi:tetrahydromethanopterin S-methyltransferase subunit E
MVEFLALCLVVGLLVAVPAFRQLLGALLALTAIGFVVIVGGLIVIALLAMMFLA